MRDNILISFLDYKTKILIDYSKTFIQMLINEHKIVAENKSIYSKTIDRFISLYVHNYYFDLEDSHDIMEKMVHDLSDSRVKNSIVIASICVESDKLLANYEEPSKKEIKKVVGKLVALFDIDLNKVRNKNAFENLADKIQENRRKEKKFLSLINVDQEEFYNLYRYNPAVKDVYFVEHNLNLEEFRKWYPANVNKALNDNEIGSAMTLISLQTLSSLILKELIKNHKSDRFILRVHGGLLKSSKKISDLQRMLNNGYLKKSLYLLIDFEDYKAYPERVKQLTQMGYRYLLDVKTKLNDTDFAPNETLYLSKDIIEQYHDVVNMLIERGVVIVEKNNMFTFTEEELLNKNKEEL